MLYVIYQINWPDFYIYIETNCFSCWRGSPKPIPANNGERDYDHATSSHIGNYYYIQPLSYFDID